MRNDRFGTVLLDEEGAPEKLLTRCPHCGMIDYQFMNQSGRSSHYCNSKVGGVSHYQCGKCRGYFATLTIQVPEGMTAMELYERINRLADSLLGMADNREENDNGRTD